MAVTTVYTDRDCEVLSSQPNTTGMHCSFPSVESVTSGSDTLNAVFGFQIPSIPISANITSVSLKLRRRFRGTLDTQTLKRITADSWGECTSSYNILTVTDTNLTTFSMPVNDAWVSINVTDMYKDAKDAAMSIFGVRVTNPATNGATLWARDNGSGYIAYIEITYTTAKPMKINIGDSWKDVDAMKINIGDTWKDVVSVKQNIGDTWKTVF